MIFPGCPEDCVQAEGRSPISIPGSGLPSATIPSLGPPARRHTSPPKEAHAEGGWPRSRLLPHPELRRLPLLFGTPSELSKVLTLIPAWAPKNSVVVNSGYSKFIHTITFLKKSNPVRINLALLLYYLCLIEIHLYLYSYHLEK